jgi:CRP-like cAMP-binding protein
MPPPTLRAPRNRLLAALPAAERRRLLAHQEPIELVAGDTLTEPGERIRHVIFPTDSVISLIKPITGHRQVEVGFVGNEGVLGACLALGMNEAPLRGLVQSGGLAWSLGAAAVLRELEFCPSLRRDLHRYSYVLLTQLAQTAACTRFHVVHERLARWLLVTRDRVRSNQFQVTHVFLAYVLGVRRVGVTRAAGLLQERKLIRYERGRLTICDGRGLEAAACECYAADKAAYARTFRRRNARSA